MKAGIHPKYYKAIVTCACGEPFETRSTKPQIRVEVCSKCHPFYTGQRQVVTTTGGRIERFRSRWNLNEEEK